MALLRRWQTQLKLTAPADDCFALFLVCGGIENVAQVLRPFGCTAKQALANLQRKYCGPSHGRHLPGFPVVEESLNV